MATAAAVCAIVLPKPINALPTCGIPTFRPSPRPLTYLLAASAAAPDDLVCLVDSSEALVFFLRASVSFSCSFNDLADICPPPVAPPPPAPPLPCMAASIFCSVSSVAALSATMLPMPGMLICTLAINSPGK